MLQQESSSNKGLDNSSIAKPDKKIKPTFVLCEKCYWCMTLLNTSDRIIRCPSCSSHQLTSFPIMSDEVFTFDYSEKRGLELDFRKKKKNH